MYQKPDYGQTDIYDFILPFGGHDEFVSAVEKYHEGFGYYPESILADKIYRNRKNRGFCKRNHIKISDPKVGKPGKRKLGLGLMKCQFIPQKKHGNQFSKISQILEESGRQSSIIFVWPLPHAAPSVFFPVSETIILRECIKDLRFVVLNC